MQDCEIVPVPSLTPEHVEAIRNEIIEGVQSIREGDPFDPIKIEISATLGSCGERDYVTNFHGSIFLHEDDGPIQIGHVHAELARFDGEERRFDVYSILDESSESPRNND